MKVTVVELIEFVLAEGDAFNLTFAGIEEVGIDRVLRGIDNQFDPRTGRIYGARLVGAADETDKLQAMRDYFAESYGRDSDLAWMEYCENYGKEN